jgi:hypothetical protein
MGLELVNGPRMEAWPAQPRPLFAPSPPGQAVLKRKASPCVSVAHGAVLWELVRRCSLRPSRMRWSLDFVHDQFASGRRFRILNIVDDVARECLAAIPDISISMKIVGTVLIIAGVIAVVRSDTLKTRPTAPGIIRTMSADVFLPQEPTDAERVCPLVALGPKSGRQWSGQLEVWI